MNTHWPQIIAGIALGFIVLRGVVRAIEYRHPADFIGAALKAAAIITVLTWGGFFK